MRIKCDIRGNILKLRKRKTKLKLKEKKNNTKGVDKLVVELPIRQLKIKIKTEGYIGGLNLEW